MQFKYVFGDNVERLYPDVRISIERISPQQAKAMLQANVHNRDLTRENTERAIRSGEWELNGATIVFDENGVLLDGQHRLMACVKANKPIDTIVVRGISMNAQVTMDTGTKRQVAHYLKMMGYGDPNVTAAIARVLLRSDRDGMESAFGTANNDKMTVKAVLDYVEENYHDRIKPTMRYSRAVQKKYKGIRAGTIAVIVDKMRTINCDEESVEDFFEQLTKMKPACMTIQALQRRLENNSESKVGKLPQRIIGALVIKTWNSFVYGEERQSVGFRQTGRIPEEFPEVMQGF